MPAQFYLSSSAFRDSPEHVVDYARRHAYAGVEWYLDQRRLPIAREARRSLLAAMQADGLGARFHAPAADVELGHRDPAIADASLRYLVLYLDLLSETAPTIMTVHVGSRAIPTDDLSWEVTLAHLRRVAAEGRARGITVCLENLKRGWTSDPQRLLAMAEAAETALTFDLGHASASPFVEGGDTLEAFFEVIRPRVANVHVYALETPDGRHLPLDTLAHHRRALDALLSHGVRTWVLELSNPDDLAHTRQALRPYDAG